VPASGAVLVPVLGVVLVLGVVPEPELGGVLVPASGVVVVDGVVDVLWSLVPVLVLDPVAVPPSSAGAVPPARLPTTTSIA